MFELAIVLCHYTPWLCMCMVEARGLCHGSRTKATGKATDHANTRLLLPLLEGAALGSLSVDGPGAGALALASALRDKALHSSHIRNGAEGTEMHKYRSYRSLLSISFATFYQTLLLTLVQSHQSTCPLEGNLVCALPCLALFLSCSYEGVQDVDLALPFEHLQTKT